MPPLRRSPDYEKMHDWLEAPLKDFPRDKARGLLGLSSGLLGEVDRAARREYCDWGARQCLRRLRFQCSQRQFSRCAWQ